jgi:hypothetical protein
MQHVASRPNPPSGGNARAQKIVIVAIILFALAGLMSGFGVGAATRPHQQTANTPPPQHKSSPPVAQTTQKSTPTPKVDPILAKGIGCPNPTYSFAQNADGITDYKLTALIVDQSISKQPTPCGTGKTIKATGLTCKLWLTDNLDSLHTLSRAQLSPVSNLQQTFPKEKQGALNFDGGQQQIQPCSPTGTTSWSFTLSPDLKSGTYYLAVVADYDGKVFNWSWRSIIVQRNHK